MLRVVTPLNKGTKTKLRPLGCAATFRTNACGAAVRAEATKLAKAIAPTQYAVGRKAARNHSRETLLAKPRSRPHDRFSPGVRVLQDSESMCSSPCAEKGLRPTCGGPHSTHRQLHGYHSADLAFASGVTPTARAPSVVLGMPIHCWALCGPSQGWKGSHPWRLLKRDPIAKSGSQKFNAAVNHQHAGEVWIGTCGEPTSMHSCENLVCSHGVISCYGKERHYP